jgi:transposase
VEGWVGADHPARFIREVVEQLDLEELGRWGEGEGGQGRPHYGGKLLLKAWLYG